MIRRIPILATIVVVAAVLLMVRLGVWQLHRLDEKEALLAHFAANAARPAAPLRFPVTESALYRRSTADCQAVTGWRTEAGRTTAGEVGWRHIATCRTASPGESFAVDMGTSQSPAPPKDWRGGPVSGRLTWAPSAAPLIARLVSAGPPPEPMIVSARAAPGLVPTAQPDPGAITNNHLSYAVQWFAFAGMAALIYALLLRRRLR